jgi:NAD(P)-dependent dehydrogenase (short-subunit alcohol dehydrogenase family)
MPSNKDNAAKTFFVTGVTFGIGLVLARALAHPAQRLAIVGGSDAGRGHGVRGAEDIRAHSLRASVFVRSHTQRSDEDTARGKRQDPACDAAKRKSAGRSALPAAADDDHLGAVFSGDVQNLLPRRPTPDQRLDVDPAARRARCANLVGELFQ